MLAQSGVTLFLFGTPGSASGNGYELGVSPPAAVPTGAAGDFLPAGIGVCFLLIYDYFPPPSIELLP